jgi:predicted acyltransferase
VFAGRWIASGAPLERRLVGLFGAGALAAMLGAMWGWSFPINKNMWTSSYVLFTARLAALTLATTLWVVDGLGARRWTVPFVIFGTNPIVAFAGSSVMARMIYSVLKVESGGTTVPLQAAIYETLFGAWLPPRDASLAFAIAFVALWLLLLTPLYRKGWFLKV